MGQKKVCNLLEQKNHATSWDKKNHATFRDKKNHATSLKLLWEHFEFVTFYFGIVFEYIQYF